ncbi:MAG: 1-acyl-sn-glycerol-3-phosphate acyltransferase [Solirubrobacterales bacterium]|jgi:1-acyl-sn-glycerol-3-phosphate acyltransferase|nr:1-acyl-sn-glycerol-3-phosphate acyltransferase [Solirubrobacterales bacterium]
MADPAILAERAKKNGGGEAGAGEGSSSFAERMAPLGVAGDAFARVGGGVADAATAVAGGIVGRVGRRIGQVLSADLDDRDPDYIRENLPLSWLAATLWYRAEVRNMGNVPERGAVLLVGNHTGGNMSPEVIVLPLAFSTYFGVERPFYQLAHNLVLASPLGPFLRRYGAMPASHEHAREALRSGAAVLVFPGGDWEVHRPSWEGNRVDFAGRTGFVKLALSENVEIVPVVTIGGQETALFLSRGAWLAKLTRADRLLRLKVIPISLALPWILNVGDLLGHLPLPAKITIEVLPPIDPHERFGHEPDPDEVYEHVIGVMQEALDGLAAERRFPVIG